MAQRKAVTWNYDDIISTDNTTLRAHLLTDRDVQIFAAIVQQLGWRTRWTGAISPAQWDALQAEIAASLDRIMIPVDICNIIADCIRDSGAVRNALANYGIATATSQSVADTGTNLLQGVPCDNDTLYGACVAIVDFANDLSTDFLERVANDATFTAAVARILDLLPVVGDLPVIDDLNDFVEWVSENGITLYESGYTVTLRQEIICGMFCLAQAACDLTIDDVLAAYAAKLSIVVAVTDPIDLLIRAIVQTIADTDFALALNLIILSVLASGGEALGFVGLPSLSALARTANPDSDWAIFCAPCPLCMTYDFTTSDGNWFATAEGMYEAGVGWGSNPSNNPGRIAIYSPPPGPGTYKVTARMDAPIGGNLGEYYLRVYKASPLTFIRTDKTVTAPGATFIDLGDVALVAGEIIRIDMAKSVDANDTITEHVIEATIC